MDSTGLAAIFNGARELKMAGVALVAVASNSDIVKLFELTAMGEAVPLFPTRDRALAELDGQLALRRLSAMLDLVREVRLIWAPAPGPTGAVRRDGC